MSKQNHPVRETPYALGALSLALLAIVLAWLPATPAAASNQTFWGGSRTWTGRGADTNWSTAANWNAPVSGYEQLCFGAVGLGAHTSNQNDLGGYAAGFSPSLQFNGIVFASDAPSYDLKGCGIFLADSIVNNSHSTQTISLDGLVLPSQSGGWYGYLGMGLCLVGGTYNFDTAGGDISVNCGIMETSRSAIVKTGSGTLSVNNYIGCTGGVTVSEGTLRLGTSGSLGSGDLTVGMHGTVDLNGTGASVASLSGEAGGVITDNSMPAASPSPTGLWVNVDSGTSTFGGAIVKGANGQDIALTKWGYGVLTLSGINNYSGGTNVDEGTLNITGTASGGNVGINMGATLNVTGTMSGGSVLMEGGTLNVAGTMSSGGVEMCSGATLNVTGTLSGGSVMMLPGATLSGSGTVNSSISGFTNSSIVATGNLSLGDRTSYTGFNHAGTLAVGANNVTLNSAGFANLGILTTLGGGTLSAPNGVSLGVGCNLTGSGAVNGKVAAGYGSTINATGNLTLGDSTKYDGFVSDGELYTNSNTVTLNSKNAANNHNAVVLGALTQLDGGTLVAPNGILLANGKNLVTTDAGGTVSAAGGPSASRFLNRGSVQGPSSASSNWLIFNMLFKGSTGQTSGRIGYLGGFATGDCPGVNTQYGAALLGGTGSEFDIGGRTPGNSDNNYGQLNILADPNDAGSHGDLTFFPGTTLNVVDWNGFAPTVGDQFTILTWDGSLSGTASLSIDSAFASNGIRFVPEWNLHSLVLDATSIPEPSTLILLVIGTISSLLVYAWRRRTQTA